jgi:ribosomal subunit interface protein
LHINGLQPEGNATMLIPVQLVTRGMAASDAVDSAVGKHVAKLERFCDHITSCRVTVELAARHKHDGNLYAVHIDLSVPGDEIVSTRRHESEDVYVAMGDAFDAAQRRLEDYVRERRGQVKRHAS